MKHFVKKPWVPWVGILVIVVLAAGIWIARTRRPMQPLTADLLNEAEQRWKTNGPPNYEMDVIVSGVQHATYHITVKNGSVVAMTESGTPTPEHVWAYWNVNGMLRFLDEELTQAAHPMTAYGATDPGQVYLAASFDAHYGYPRFFLRQVFGKALTIEWETRHFEVKP